MANLWVRVCLGVMPKGVLVILRGVYRFHTFVIDTERLSFFSRSCPCEMLVGGVSTEHTVNAYKPSSETLLPTSAF